MANNKQAIIGLFALILVFANAPTSQAAEQTGDVSNEPKAPIVIDADELYYSDSTGELFAKGEVKVTKNTDQILSDLINGNTKQTKVWADKATLLQPDAKITGNHFEYNYEAHTGSMLNFSGQSGNEYITGKDIDILPEKLIFANGTITKCPAKVPDYHLSADKVEIWPGEKMVLHNARFWIKDFILFTLPKYQTSLKDGSESQMPRIGYDSEDGFYIRQYLESPITEKVAAFADIGYYSDPGWRSSYGIVDRETNYQLGLLYGYDEDDDDNWIKKEPEFNFNYYSKPLGKLPYNFRISAVYGKWIQNDISSWHQDYEIYLSRHPINISESTKLYLGTGWEVIKESYNDSTNNIVNFDATLRKTWSPKLATWAGYHYTKNNNTLFDYDRTDLSRERVLGLSYKFDDKNTVSYNQSYDMTNHRRYEDTYTWTRDLHCWTATISYEDDFSAADDDSIRFKINTKVW